MGTPSKADDLRCCRCWHTAFDRVADPLFRVDDFFDPRDLLLVKYELLRRVRCEGLPVLQAVRRFAVARATYYQAASAGSDRGLLGLLPRRTGPRQGYKLTADLVATLTGPAQTAAPSPDDLARRLWEQHRLRVHPRSIARALRPREKGGPTTPWIGSPTGTTATRSSAPTGLTADAVGPVPWCGGRGYSPGCRPRPATQRPPRPARPPLPSRRQPTPTAW
jgi:hypothetical protein